jgi:hypothetical protein
LRRDLLGELPALKGGKIFGASGQTAGIPESYGWRALDAGWSAFGLYERDRSSEVLAFPSTQPYFRIELPF